MWTDENRARYDRSKLRYPSDLTDAEWELVRPCIPSCKRGGRQRTVDLREVVNGIVARAIDPALVLLAEVRAAAQRRHDADAPELRVAGIALVHE
jgi:hypothetical protein